MQEKLVVYIHAHSTEHPSWAVLGADGSVRQSAIHDSPEGLAQIAVEKQVIVIIPAEDVLLTQTRLPKMNRTRLQQAVPFALEEQLISDVESLHFAIGDYQPDNDFGVAIVSHEKMQQWLRLLQTWQLKAHILVALPYALAYDENTWHVLIQDMVVIRTSQWLGLACDRNNFSQLQKPAQVIIKNYSSQPIQDEALLPAEAFITDIAQSILTTPYINLLQGSYAVKKSRFSQVDNLGQKVITLAKVVLILLFLYPFGSLLILNNRAKTIDDQIAVIYKSNFPEASSVVAPKMRMQEKLNKLEAKIAENRFLLLLGYIGKSMQATPSIKLKRLDYQHNQMTLSLMAASSDDFSSFTDFLTTKGLKVKQQNAALSGARVQATLQVE